jgi:hypothetical protein
MKLTFKNDIRTKSGKSWEGDSVFFARRNKTLASQRRYTKPILTSHNELVGQKAYAASLLWKEVSLAFKEDLRHYSRLYNQQIQPTHKGHIGMYNVFVKALMKQDVPITSMAVLRNILGYTLEDWIMSGILPNVNKNKVYTSEITQS